MAKNTSTAFLIPFVLLVLIPLGAYATQGACSYHGGVNCSAGANYNGNVTCNDSWVNSSVLYSDTDECKFRDLCPTIIYGMTCNTESDYARVQKKVDNMRGQRSAINARSGIYSDVSYIGQDELDSCREEIGIFNRLVAAHDKCESERQDQIRQEGEEWNLNFEITKQSKLNAFCVQYHGVGSVWNESLPFDDMTAKCTQSINAQIDAAFQKAFKPAMDSLPEYADIVDPEVIKKLSLDPVNGDKTFTQIIIERYGDELASRKASETALAEKTKTETTALNAQVGQLQAKPITNTKKKIKAAPPAAPEKEVIKPIQDKAETPKPAVIKVADVKVIKPVKKIWWRKVKDWLGF